MAIVRDGTSAGEVRVDRAGLSRRLGAALEGAGRVVLVADAGFGKTMALEDAIARAGLNAAWISCPGGDGGAGGLLLQ